MHRLIWILSLLLSLLTACAPAAAPTPTAAPTVVPTTTNTPPPEPTAAPTETPGPTPSPLQVTKDITYTTSLEPEARARALDVYAPAVPGPWPVVVLVPGFQMRKEGYRLISEAIASQGAVVFTINWAAWTSPTGAAQGSGAKLREWSETVTCAARFARATASDYGGDPGRVTLVGHSLGGGLGLWEALGGDDLEPLWEGLASTRGGPPPQIGCLASGVSAYPDAFVGYGGAYASFEFLKEEDPEMWAVASPFAFIDSNPNLRIRFIHGEWDSVISAEHVDLSVQLLEDLTDAGYDATWTAVDAGHNFSHTGPAGEATLRVIMEAARD